MSYFTNKNTKEFGPGPDKEVEWLLVDTHKMKFTKINAQFAFEALQKARSKGFSNQFVYALNPKDEVK